MSLAQDFVVKRQDSKTRFYCSKGGSERNLEPELLQHLDLV